MQCQCLTTCKNNWFGSYNLRCYAAITVSLSSVQFLEKVFIAVKAIKSDPQNGTTFLALSWVYVTWRYNKCRSSCFNHDSYLCLCAYASK